MIDWARVSDQKKFKTGVLLITGVVILLIVFLKQYFFIFEALYTDSVRRVIGAFLSGCKSLDYIDIQQITMHFGWFPKYSISMVRSIVGY